MPSERQNYHTQPWRCNRRSWFQLSRSGVLLRSTNLGSLFRRVIIDSSIWKCCAGWVSSIHIRSKTFINHNLVLTSILKVEAQLTMTLLSIRSALLLPAHRRSQCRLNPNCRSYLIRHFYRYYVTAAPQCVFPDAALGSVLNAVGFDAIYGKSVDAPTTCH